MDFAVTDVASNSVVVAAGYGDGVFRILATYAAGVAPVALAAGDLNGDGWIDLVTVNQGAYDPNSTQYTNSGISILIGNGNGTFQPAINYRAGTSPQSIAIGDLNADGQLDLAVGNWVSRDVSILLGNGDGTFQDATSFPAGGYAAGLVISDFNGDGWLDVAVAGDFGISVLFGNGDGNLQPPVQLFGDRCYSLFAADFNKDGHSDLVVADDDTRSVSILLNKGNGTFRIPINYETASGMRSIAVSDLNGDGAADLAVADYDGVSILLGRGDGTFNTAGVYGPPFGSRTVAVADFNGDGAADFAAVSSTPQYVWVQLGTGSGSFEQPLSHGLATFSFPASLAMGDLNGDGQADLVAGSEGATPSISVLLGQAEVGFRQPVQYNVGSGPKSVALGDFNADGKLDIATANSGSTNMSVLLGKGDGTFSNAVFYTTGLLPIAIATADFDRDGHPDIALVDDLVSGDVSVLLGIRTFKGTGDGSFLPGPTYPAGTNAQHVAAGDVNGDGYPDLVVANFTTPSSVTVLLGKGDGTFAEAVSYAAGGIGAVYVTLGDINGDGKLDLAVLNSIFSTLGNSSSVSILLGKGDGTFQPPIQSEVEADARNIALGDFNGDGKVDLAVAGWPPQTPIGPDLFPVSVRLGNGDGTFQTAFFYAAGTKPQFILASDFNHDGRPDLVVACAGSSFPLDVAGPAVAVLINRCSTSEASLSITLDALNIHLSWPFPSTGFALEFTTSLSSTDWQLAAEVPVPNNGRLEVSVPVSPQQKYFRLRKP